MTCAERAHCEFMDGIIIVDYAPRYASELVLMWRASFEHGVGIIDPHPLEDQLRALEEKIVPKNRVRIHVLPQ